MKLQKALKLKNTLAGEISALQQLIKQKNSFTEGSVNVEAFDNRKMYEDLLSKIEKLVNLKILINDANEEIQAKIYQMSEYKSLISFWQGMPVVSGTITTNSYGGGNSTINYIAQFSEVEKLEKIKEFQKLVDSLQEDIDTHNFLTEIPFDE